MSEQSRRKRSMRLQGKKRVKIEKLKGLPPGVTPKFRPPELFANAYVSQDPGVLITEHDPWLGRDPIMSQIAENEPQIMEEVTDGTEPDRDETEPARSPDTVAGVELEEREIQSREGDNTPLAEKRTAKNEPADDQS